MPVCVCVCVCVCSHHAYILPCIFMCSSLVQLFDSQLWSGIGLTMILMSLVISWKRLKFNRKISPQVIELPESLIDVPGTSLYGSCK